jgi:ABC-type antimicrobial peptide transport system permease subunit
MLGIVIGVAAVIVTVAIGAGARISVQSSINSLGSNLIVVQPGSVTQTGVRSGLGGASTLTPDDGLAIAKLPGVASVSPQVTVRTQVVAGENNWQTTVTGVAPTYTFIRSWPLASGRFFGESDLAGGAKVAVLGATVVQQLFPDGQSPIGTTVVVKGAPFTVIGTLTPLGQSGMGQDQDDTVLVPYTSAMERLTGLTTVNALLVSAADSGEIDAVARAAPSNHGVSTRRLSGEKLAIDRSSGVANRRGDGVLAGRRGGRVTRGRRHRHHEHHDGFGHRANPRDRSPYGGRRTRKDDSQPISDRVDRPRNDRRTRRRRSRHARDGFGRINRPLADVDSPAVGRRIGALRVAGRSLFRVLPGPKGGSA